jgi:hypothetical protein
MGSLVAELEATHGPFRLFALVTRSAHVSELGKWFLMASAEWMDQDCDGAQRHLFHFIAERVGPSEILHLSHVVVKPETVAPISEIQRKLGWVIRDNGFVGELAIGAPAIYAVYRCLPNGEEFPEGVDPEAGPAASSDDYPSDRRLDGSVVPIEVQEKIVRMARPANWAGEGSGAITREACSAAIDFVGRALTRGDGLESPRVGPSPLGAVALQWDFDEDSLVVRVSSETPGIVHFQEEGPDFHQEEGFAPREAVLERLSMLAKKHVFN